ncbi:homoprotocatechuate degradation operon regulator HpaR [Snodgrassella alvi]|jgi:homoprotocatechuate degradation regulator HpaR|uniref:Homoprotocatechuate degradation operon regulator, HpaR n=1 Tax=Snodgrassella alvi TaxID=1196083 RepID=A0A855FX90_9NEIS|nr:homoprotocatechuate degradation operon regulator HpaR [Snodgrassella alvi]PIT11048.1 homoprotocatechuate degradation operon regulator, HpaR [Snodgrassella alvi]PIT22574.1 homoprotocatechuate degradation operon regulator, HpaR [Snodgrassella alvi]PIT47036.1 homoprotocatechuate degradation operon regulator, HpaR [Snodgrassella alvi]PIT55251.1 homoprotocatechuate degradation operon regulator, HpaR [Snodgrassella alvi]PIT58808.1 homoprotocatechuate degradation operon regulator, HpaR [Snodgrasse
MVNTSKYSSLNIVLIQTREALLSHFRPMLNDIGITDQQWRITRLLAENGIMDFQELAKQACILRPSLTGILTRLEKLGYVVRLKPSNDQRRVFLKLTQEGEKLYENFCVAVDARYKVLEQRFTQEKLQQLGSLLKEFTNIAVDKEEQET